MSETASTTTTEPETATPDPDPPVLHYIPTSKTDGTVSFRVVVLPERRRNKERG